MRLKNTNCKSTICQMNSEAKGFTRLLRCERGVMNFVTLAISLPVLILLILGSMDLFLYFRATAVVERAISEASQTMAAAEPGKPGDYNTYSLGSVASKTVYSTTTGGDTEGDYANSFIKHGKLYIPPDWTIASADIKNTQVEKIPFSLVTQPSLTINNDNSVTYTDGVQYLPRVHVPACLEPKNETIPTLNASACSKIGILRYELPSRMDFDGDGREDIAFFNSSGSDNYWVIPSSTGGLFKHSITAAAGSPTKSATTPQLPCPADYDGDGKTDFCVMALDGSNNLSVRMNLSSTYYYYTLSATIAGLPATQVIPVPGRWSKGASQDQFAILIIQGTTAASHLSTRIYSAITADGAGVGAFETYSFNATPANDLNTDWYKPQSGRYWRPVFQDHDGDQAVDVGWFTWDGGNELFHIAGTGTAGRSSSYTGKADEINIMPWQLFYPASASSPGLYVVERYNHRVSLITKGNDSVVNADLGKSSTEEWRRIAGAQDLSGTITNTPDLDPLSRGRLDATASPTADGDEGCVTCADGGVWGDDDNKTAHDAFLDSPRAVFTTGKSGAPLFIADFGNARVRKIVETGGDNYIDGTDSEVISTVVGGKVVPGVTCPALSSSSSSSSGTDSLEPSLGMLPNDAVARGRLAWPGEEVSVSQSASSSSYGAASIPIEELPVSSSSSGSPPPVEGEAALPWTDYTQAARDAGIHPSCVRVRPLGIVVDDDSDMARQVMFVADEGGVIFRVDPGADNLFNADTDTSERMYRYMGYYNDWSITAPPAGTSPSDSSVKFGIPNSLAFYDDGPSKQKYLLIGVSHWGLPVSGNSTTATGGGVIVVSSGADRNWVTGDDVIAANWGSWKQTTSLPQAHAKTSALTVRNPTDLAVLPWDNSPYSLPIVAFASGWWSDPNSSPGYEQSVIQLSDVYGRWVNNPHTKHWGMMAPSQEVGPYSFSYDQRKPVGTVPIEPTGGVAVSPDGQFLYVAETTRGMIQAIRLDRDLDGDIDVSDKDIDGDGTQIPTEATDGTDPWVGNARAVTHRTIDGYADARMWAVTHRGKAMNAGGTLVDRLEWLIDRYGETAAVPDADTGALPKGQEAPFRLLNDDTIAYAAPRGVLHSTPVWSGGIDRSTETNLDARLAPLVLGDIKPNRYFVKGVSGYDHCSDWSMDQDAATGLTVDGAPVTTCGRSIASDIAQGYALGLRRVHLAHWAGQWHSFNGGENVDPNFSKEGQLLLLDVDGDSARDAAVYNVWRADTDTTPLMIYMKGCFSDAYETELDSIAAAAASLTSIKMDNDHFGQARCRSDTQFFSDGNTEMSTFMADVHAEWDVVTSSATTSYSAVTSNRLSLGTDGDGDPSGSIGPVAETAYRILEQALRVDTREDASNAYGAMVEFGSPSSTGKVDISVSYVYPLSPFMAAVKGTDKVVIAKKGTYRLYNFGRGS